MPRFLADGRFKTPVGISRIVTPTCERSMSSKTSISRLPGWLTAGLHYASVLLLYCDDSWPPLIGVSDREFKVPKHHVPGIPDFPMGPNADGSRWLPPVPQMDGSDCIGIFSTDFPTSCSQSSRLFPDDGHLSSTLTLVVPQRLRHCWDIADRDSQRRGFFVFENPDFRSPTLRDLLPCVPVVWTALILSGNCGSRFLDATILHS
jgi:hypothetical protein